MNTYDRLESKYGFHMKTSELSTGLKQIEPAGSRGLRVEGNGAGLSVMTNETSPGETRTVQVSQLLSGTVRE